MKTSAALTPPLASTEPAAPAPAAAPARVLVTRPRAQAETVCRLLRARHLEPVCLPAIRVEPLEETPALDAAVRRLDRYRWLVLPSANALRCFVARLEALGLAPAAIARLRIVAGPATALALAEYGLQAALVPAPFSAAAAVAAMRDAVTPGDRVLVPGGQTGRDELGHGLRALGAEVDEAPVYRTVAAGAPDEAAEVAALLASGQIAAITFFSPSAVGGVAGTLQATGASEAQVSAWLGRIAIACIGPTTAAAVQAAGWHVSLVAPQTTAESLVAAVADYLFSDQQDGIILESRRR